MMNISRKKLALILLIILVVVVLLISFSSHRKKNSNPVLSSTLSSEALSVVTKYLQARENSVGADQSTPNSWLIAVQPITTTSWFSQLQPNPNPSTSNTSNDYRQAHQYNYSIKVYLSGCTWSNNLASQTATQGAVACRLSDTTIDRATNTTVPALSLPFGWTHNGQQVPPKLDLIKQNGQWFINGDSTGEGQ
jgi:hypothetical protein